MSTIRSQVKKRFPVTAIVPAAGLSRRMGRFKPLLPLGPDPAVVGVVKTFQSAGVQDILVVTGYRGAEVRQAVAPLAVRCVENAAYRNGMFSSVLAGIRALPARCPAFFIHPADIPLVRPRTIRRLAAAFAESAAAPAVLYPVFDGLRGHPTLISTGLVPDILQWPGTDGLRGLLKCHDADSMELDVADEGILLDLDTPDDYRRLQAKLAGFFRG